MAKVLVDRKGALLTHITRECLFAVRLEVCWPTAEVVGTRDYRMAIEAGGAGVGESSASRQCVSEHRQENNAYSINSQP